MARFSLGFWGLWGRYSDYGARKQGAKDGESVPPIPDWGSSSFAPYVMELVQLAQHSMRDYASVFEEHTIRKDADMNQLAREAAHAEREKEKSAKRLKDAVVQFHGERSHHPPLKQPSLIVYGIFLIFMVLSEVPLNTMVFRLFGDNELLNIMMALGVGVAILWCAHILGHSLKEKDTGAHPKLAQAAALLGPLVIILVAATLREAYVVSNPDVANKVPRVAVFAFFAGYNLVIYIVGVLLARATHDPLLARYHQHRTEHAKHQQQYTELMERLARDIRDRSQRRQALAVEAQQTADAVKRLISTYQTENLRTRNDRGEHRGETQPVSFRDYPNIDLPQELKSESDWEPGEYKTLIEKRQAAIDASGQQAGPAQVPGAIESAEAETDAE
jgi:hypothetical protein